MEASKEAWRAARLSEIWALIEAVIKKTTSETRMPASIQKLTPKTGWMKSANPKPLTFPWAGIYSIARIQQPSLRGKPS
jgi:hypothetical protein